ncbi:hypothetical protein [Changpingibacter yushuensis]|uniref:hypothetical protein n=1 Tax=Changpingibacter yushuensis TaxID=2758440 RepID=UPI0015F64C5F|nr:hypothetical protein [Changpingibacter yushuensis]
MQLIGKARAGRGLFVVAMVVASSVLVGCAGEASVQDTSTQIGSPSPDQTADPAPTTGAAAQIADLPEVDGFTPVAAIETRPATNPWDGTLVVGGDVVVYRSDLSAQTYTVTGYTSPNYTESWSTTGAGWLTCSNASEIVCEAMSYDQGVRTVENVFMLSPHDGTSTELPAGSPGTFLFVGMYADVAYFLTWDGTTYMHMTGFDGTGAAVNDANLRIQAPESSEVVDVDATVAGAFARVSVPGSEAVLFSFERNSVLFSGVPDECVGLSDGVVCADSSAPFIGYSISGKEWQVPVPGAILLSSTGAPNLTLRSARTMLESIADAVAAVPDADHYIVPESDSLELAQLDDGTLVLPAGYSVPLSDATVSGVDLTHDVVIVNVRRVGDATGESGGNTIDYSVLVAADGHVAASLDDDALRHLLSSRNEATMDLQPFTLGWSGNQLVFTDEVDGIVGLYVQV